MLIFIVLGCMVFIAPLVIEHRLKKAQSDSKGSECGSHTKDPLKRFTAVRMAHKALQTMFRAGDHSVSPEFKRKRTK